MRANWDAAPSWAQYAAQELSGSLYWHELEPRYLQITGEWRSKGRTQIIPKVDRPAQDTLERRPDHCTSPAFIGKLRPGESVVIHSGEL